VPAGLNGYVAFVWDWGRRELDDRPGRQRAHDYGRLVTDRVFTRDAA
jgi:hypothetical protein